MRILCRFSVVGVLASSFLVSSAALADEPAPRAAQNEDGAAREENSSAQNAINTAQADVPSTSYGYQTLATDGFATAIVGLSLTQKGPVLPAIGVLTYALGAPIVHMAHRHGEKAFADLGLRVAAPIATGFVGAIVGAASAPKSGNDPYAATGFLYIGALVGVLVGVAGAITIDATLIAREDARPADKNADTARAKRRAAPSPTQIAWTPTFAPATGGATAGVAGTF